MSEEQYKVTGPPCLGCLKRLSPAAQAEVHYRQIVTPDKCAQPGHQSWVYDNKPLEPGAGAAF